MLNNIGLPGFLIIVAVTLLLFGRGKISALMGELGSGMTAFKKGLREGENDSSSPEVPSDPSRPQSTTDRTGQKARI